jgi:hypothetical protein
MSCTVYLNVNAQDKVSECTALMIAAMKGRSDIVAMLCAYGVAMGMANTSFI